MTTVNIGLGRTLEFTEEPMSFNQWERKLIEKGVIVINVQQGFPVAVEGILPTGEWFYFRSRGKSVSLEIGDPSNYDQNTYIQGTLPDTLANNPINAALASEFFDELLRIHRETEHMPIWVRLMLEDMAEQ